MNQVSKQLGKVLSTQGQNVAARERESLWMLVRAPVPKADHLWDT